MPTLDAPRVAKLLGGRNALKRRVRSLADLESVVSEGLPWRSFRAFLRSWDPAPRALFADIVAPRTTRLRREREGRFTPKESERLERLARLAALAAEALDSESRAATFLLSPHPLLGGKVPAQLARTELGARQVEDLLGRIEYSLPV